MNLKSVSITLLLIVMAGLAAGCAPQVKVVEVQVTAESQPRVVEVTATPAPTSTPAPPPTITVCASGCDFTSIQAAVDDAGTIIGSTIDVTDSAHTEGEITIGAGKDVVIQGQGVDDTIVQAHEEAGEADDRVFFIAEGATATIRDMTIRHGHPDSEPEISGVKRTGGGIANLGTLTLENCAVRDNIGSAGGGILNRGDLTISNCTVSDNYADGVDEGRDCSSGGGIRSVLGPVHISNSTFSGNNSSRAGGAGGALHVACESTMVVTNSTLSGNNAGTIGGGAHVRGTLELVNCTISGNSAEGRGRGGDMIVPSGGGIYVNANGVLNLTNTIVANNSDDKNCVLDGEGSIDANSNSLDSDGSCSAAHSGDPLLDALGDNGGDTQTHALLPGSPAINAIDAASCTLSADQRGQARPQGARCDIGAFELAEE